MKIAKRSISELESRSSKLGAIVKFPPLVIVVDNLRSGLNVGSIFRTADVFGVEEICLCGISAQPPHREIFKTALGATETVKWTYYPNVLDAFSYLKDNGYLTIGLEQVNDSIPLHDFREKTQPIALFIGNEVDGISDDLLTLLDHFVEIPQVGTKHSLNVATATGIALWELRRDKIIESYS